MAKKKKATKKPAKAKSDPMMGMEDMVAMMKMMNAPKNSAAYMTEMRKKEKS